MFWSLTLREFMLIAQGVGRHRREQHRQQLRVAWFAAYWGRVKKLPSLEEAVPHPRRPVRPREKRKLQSQLLEAFTAYQVGYEQRLKEEEADNGRQ